MPIAPKHVTHPLTETENRPCQRSIVSTVLYRDLIVDTSVQYSKQFVAAHLPCDSRLVTVTVTFQIRCSLMFFSHLNTSSICVTSPGNMSSLCIEKVKSSHSSKCSTTFSTSGRVNITGKTHSSMHDVSQICDPVVCIQLLGTPGSSKAIDNFRNRDRSGNQATKRCSIGVLIMAK